MGQYPVISLSLKDVSGLNYEDAINQMWSLIEAEAERDEYFSDSDIHSIYHYGIAFHQKKCIVISEDAK